MLSRLEVCTLYPFSGEWVPVSRESLMTSSSRLLNWKNIGKVSPEDSSIFFCEVYNDNSESHLGHLLLCFL